MDFHPESAPDFDAHAALPLIQGLAHLHDLVALIDGDGRIEWMSDALASSSALGDGFRGHSWLDALVDPSAGERVDSALLQTGRVMNEPVRLRGHTGSEIPASLSAARLGPADGCGASVAIFRLENESAVVDREFRHTVDYLSAVLDSSPDGVVVVDRSRFITYANPAMEGITGYRIEEMIERPLALFLRGQEDLDRVAETLRFESPIKSQDLDLRHRDGEPLCVSVSASPLHLRDGTAVGAVAYLRDVTERRRFEQDLARKNDELEHYVHAVSHDLRSPLVSLLGFSRLLREDYAAALDEKGCHFVSRIEEAGRTMEHLIHDLLELSRIGRGGPAKLPVDPREVLLQLQAELKPRLDAKGVALSFPTDPPLVRCDRTRLYQLFSNLLGNALDHMGDTLNATIEVEIDSEDRNRHVRVRDNGVGIPATDHDRIFEIFQTGSNPCQGRRGTGIGLAIVQKIAATHGGRSWVESCQGEGACFHVVLPG